MAGAGPGYSRVTLAMEGEQLRQLGDIHSNALSPRVAPSLLAPILFRLAGDGRLSDF
jgi:hypothetical protein